MSRKVCVITGTRAEYGLLRLLIRAIADEPALTLQLVVTGAHLSPDFGYTYKEIEQDGFSIDRKVSILGEEDNSLGMAKSMGLALSGVADALEALQPELVVVLGDRYEIFSAVAAALALRIPVAHLHGGELTAGAIDDAMRHAITKMSHLHFVAVQEYFDRVVQMGEDPGRVFLVGGLGVDSVRHLTLMPRGELEIALGFEFGERNLLVTFHPATLDATPPREQLQALLAALDEFPDIHLVFTLPNADAGGRELGRMIESYVAQRANACLHASLGQLRYLSCVSQVDAVVGNSSSGLTEVPSYKKGTINIGDRQGGRLSGASVINADPNQAAISTAIRHLYSPGFQSSLAGTSNPYGDGGASEKIVEVIRSFPLKGLTKKIFYDLRKS